MIDFLNLERPANVDPRIALKFLRECKNATLRGFSYEDPLFEILRAQKTPVLPYGFGTLEIMGGFQVNSTVFVFYQSAEYNFCQNVLVLPNHNLEDQFIPLDVSFAQSQENECSEIDYLDIYAEGIKIGEVGTDGSEHDTTACFYHDPEQLEQAVEHKTLHNAVQHTGVASKGRKI